MSEQTQLNEQDRIFYNEVWAARKHICENCNTNIGDSTDCCFHPLLDKSKFHFLRYMPENIMLLCNSCYTSYQHEPGQCKKIIERTRAALLRFTDAGLLFLKTHSPK